MESIVKITVLYCAVRPTSVASRKMNFQAEEKYILYTDEKKFSKFRTDSFLGKGKVRNHKIKYNFRYLILITNDPHQCYSIISWRLVYEYLK